MTKFAIHHDIVLPEIVRGPKKGSLQYDNRNLVHEAAVEVIAGHYKSPYAAAMSLHAQYKSAAFEKKSIITMFVRKIKAEVSKMKAEATANIQD
jgi:hypothetical protein